MNKKSDEMMNKAKQSDALRISAWKDILISLGTGFLIFVAIALLLNPKMERLKATWVMYYGDF
ncbi:MAG: hypothetical protein COV66_05675 [Nitrospinae bacterium CG11_big_fil_rev_8_21_14_0_20_45_15]|nr:MAG: hypothetical protein COV66_05675 [Nitrospinae bacterium CG11_big_fil_rev_8_21_14_0_20_45_15]